MCGLFGFAKLDKRNTPSVRRLVRLGLEMDSRGGHAAGVCIPSKHLGSVEYWRDPMTAGDLLPQIANEIAAASPMFAIGHTRFATHGDSTNADNLHPHPYSRHDGAGVIAHNGVLWNHEMTARQYGVDLIGECDSELFARLIEADPDPDLLARVRSSIEACGTSDDIALTVAESTDDGRHRIVLAARGNPLHYAIHNGTLYWASTPTALPGSKVSRLPERAMMDMVAGSGESPVVVGEVLPAQIQTCGFGSIASKGWQSYKASKRAAPTITQDWIDAESERIDAESERADAEVERAALDGPRDAEPSWWRHGQ